ncbi:dnaJ homolog subfamily C member 2-like [Argiope bruennichi]|uniref:DnaJ subfamily C member 2 like protein n=1 Tax=Argiope bruennichi TaxID=94029 RepID=A0A8T0ETI5_ARGBR|nr:dnaJ homolog subfamily C member 2-like [Argiope bruennichi]KAF8781615.1 DnaJ subfamily C member 2 like protein [Argiope bruennichi]
MAPITGMFVEVFSPLQEFTKVKVEPVGKWFEQLQAVKANEYSLHVTSGNLAENEDEDDVSSEEDEHFEDNSDYLRKLDPKDWKNQDHYAVLGLKKKRYLAKESEIKKAYRKKVLVHHPDKRRGAGENVKDLDHDYFSCITKAYEILGNSTKRQSYDSVDPEFDDIVPPVNNYSKEHFFEEFGPIFESNARWSNKKPVPLLGNKNSTVEEVDAFYSFWYDFDSWREFSYLDEEEKEKGENREERKWIEKQNKIARQKRKKDEMARIRLLVDNAYACDPRILKFKEEEKQRKLAQKKAREEAARQKIEEDKRRRQEALEEEQRQKEKEEEEAKLKREKEKKEKEALKKQQKREKKLLQQICERNNYFASDDETKIAHLKEVDKLCNLLSLQKLQDLNTALQKEDDSNKKNVFLLEVESLKKQMELEKEQLIASAQRSSSSSEDKKASQKPWSPADLQLLVKGVNLFPAGTNNRWEVIVAFMEQHSTSNVKRTAKEVLAKAKELQKRSGGLREEINKNAYEALEKNQKQIPVAVKDQSAPTERFDVPEETPNAWTAEEQQLLEQALKTYPNNTPERWEKIAACIPGRDKKDCIKRYKDLVEMVKAKKAAQATVATKAKK